MIKPYISILLSIFAGINLYFWSKYSTMGSNPLIMNLLLGVSVMMILLVIISILSKKDSKMKRIEFTTLVGSLGGSVTALFLQ